LLQHCDRSALLAARRRIQHTQHRGKVAPHRLRVGVLLTKTQREDLQDALVEPASAG